MQGVKEQATNRVAHSSEDDMKEGDLGDGMGVRSISHLESPHQPRTRNKGDFPDVLAQTTLSKRGSEGNSGSFSWTSCNAMYTAFREELEADRVSHWRVRDSDSGAGDSSETLQRRLQEVTEEVELLRTELEVTHRHLEGKHEALRILQGQAILDKATSHTKILLQKSEERAKALEKEVNALQWEITFNQVQFKNVEHTWGLKWERVCAENKVLSQDLDKRLDQLHELRTENTSLRQQCLELLGLLSAQERRDFQKTQPPCTKGRQGSSLELAVYGACQCVSGAGEPCPCAKSAAASRKQVLQLQQELEQQRRKMEEAFVMMDAFRIAFEQQLQRGSEEVLRLAAGDKRSLRCPERGKPGPSTVAQRLRKFLPSAREGKTPTDPTETLHLLLDLLCDKEEALAHQRKVSYMLARCSEGLGKCTQEPVFNSAAGEGDVHVSGQLDGERGEPCGNSEDGATAGPDCPCPDAHGSVTMAVDLEEQQRREDED